jgi:hypothetical protein
MSTSSETFIAIINQSEILKTGILSNPGAEFSLRHIQSSHDVIELYKLYVLIKAVEGYYQNYQKKHEDYLYNCNFEHVMLTLLEEIYEDKLYYQTPDKQNITLYKYLTSVIDDLVIFSNKGLCGKGEICVDNKEFITKSLLYKFLEQKQLESQDESLGLQQENIVYYIAYTIYLYSIIFKNIILIF